MHRTALKENQTHYNINFRVYLKLSSQYDGFVVFFFLILFLIYGFGWIIRAYDSSSFSKQFSIKSKYLFSYCQYFTLTLKLNF